MAIGTGFVVGYFSSAVIVVYAPPMNAIIGALIGFIIYQYISYERFWGSRRGEFEYEYRIELAEKTIKKLVLKTFGILTFIKYFQDQFNAIRASQKTICQNLLKNENISHDNKSLYCLYYKLSDLELREDNFIEEKRMLNSAISLRPNDLLANYRLALCCEIDGSVDDAINHYELAANDSGIHSAALKSFILSQVERIKIKGPRKSPPSLGTRYQAW